MVVRVLTWLISLLFVAAGVPKLLALGSSATEFARMGYSTGFRILIGVLEIGGGLALLMRSTALYGAGLLLAIMAGATWTLVTVGDSPVPPIVVGALIVVLMVAHLRSDPG
jgi:putative oxidoreductase